MSWYIGALRKYAVFSGRARRREFWMFALCNYIIGIALWAFVAAIAGLDILLGRIDSPVLAVVAFAPLVVYELGIIVPSLAIMVRRLHDRGHSAWWMLLSLVPYAGIVLLIFAMLDGQPHPNRYGPSPKHVPAYYPFPYPVPPGHHPHR
ncbi:DUF805 domain-containing protein [Glycomyces sp. MUSA5-2]|uniref:DUF805 domain-containing protein n=1 Tax=Glycomyces sp. MUSA5-2 TaxID=2053002 RepID=UPI00300BA73F